MRLKHSVALLLGCALLNGCVATTVLNRGTQKKGDRPLQTPSLHSVPDRPERTSAAARTELLEDMQESYQTDRQAIPNNQIN